VGTSTSSDLIQLRMKLLDGKLFVSGVNSGTKSVKGLGRATTETATKQRYAERTTSRLTDSYKKLGSAAKWGLGFLGVGGVLAIESSIHASEELGKTTAGLTRNLDLQNNVASRWGAVAQAREIDSKSLTMSFTTLSRRMVEAGRKGGTLLTPFHQLGLSQEDAAKGSKNFEWSLMRVAKAFGEAKGGAVRQAAAQQLLGRGYSTILPLFSEGTKSLKEQLGWADKYGVTLSGSTTDGLMEMVQAQRENKVAMLGLQISLTKALMPAIKAGDDELQKFIATLNNPHLTAEQKISRISHQFLLLEDDLINIIEQALPHIAENAGHLGVAMAGAVLHGFENSNAMGKLALGAWFFGSMMLGIVKERAQGAGRIAGLNFSEWFILGVAGFAIGWELGKLLEEKTHGAFHRWAISEAENFANTFTGAVNDLMDTLNPLGGLGVDAPNIPGVHLKDAEEEVAEGKHITHHLPPHGQIPPGSEGPGITTPLPSHHKHHRGHGAGRPQPRVARRATQRLETAPALIQQGGASGRPIVLQIQHRTELDGKVVAENTTRHALDEAALG